MAVTDLPVKESALISASYSLNLSESRLLLLTLIIAKELLHAAELNALLGNRIEVSAERYADMFDVPKDSAYCLMQDTCRSLFKRQFSYTEQANNGNLWHRTSHWVIDIAYLNETNTVSLNLAPAVISSIVDLEQHLMSYDIRKVVNLNNAHTIRLYELLTTLHRTGKTPRVSLEQLRDKLGILEGEYKRMFDFKRQVLDYSIAQINEHTDIQVSYEQHKKVRTISGFTFEIEIKKDI
ncbi:replication initiation protein RepM [Psychrobacter immobilis]|uniref:replication initiation protein RepM n=1 Tax=Psychrobacter immobilis TaxID=498 RepID=UPI003FD1CA31